MKIARRDFILSSLAAGAALLGGPATRYALAAKPRRNQVITIFYSWGGNTKAIAQRIHQKVGGDLVELELVRPYSANYNTCLDEARRDQTDQARPELKTRLTGFERYDTVLIGYPNWWASIPMPIATLLEAYDFTGKSIVPFCSHGGGRLGRSVTDIAKLAAGANVREALSVHYDGGASLDRDIDEWLRKNGVTA